jgi:hypothetical protein
MTTHQKYSLRLFLLTVTMWWALTADPQTPRCVGKTVKEQCACLHWYYNPATKSCYKPGCGDGTGGDTGVPGVSNEPVCTAGKPLPGVDPCPIPFKALEQSSDVISSVVSDAYVVHNSTPDDWTKAAHWHRLNWRDWSCYKVSEFTDGKGRSMFSCKLNRKITGKEK